MGNYAAEFQNSKTPQQKLNEIYSGLMSAKSLPDYKATVKTAIQALRQLEKSSLPSEARGELTTFMGILKQKQSALDKINNSSSQKNKEAYQSAVNSVKAEVTTSKGYMRSYLGDSTTEIQTSTSNAAGFFTTPAKSPEDFVNSYLSKNNIIADETRKNALIGLVEALDVLDRRMDLNSAQAVEKIYSKYMTDPKSFNTSNRRERDAANRMFEDAARQYLSSKNNVLAGIEKPQDINFFAFLSEEMDKAQTAMSATISWLSTVGDRQYPDRNSSDIKALSEMLPGRKNAGKLEAMGFPPEVFDNIKGNKLFEQLFLRNYGVSSAMEFYDGLPSELKTSGAISVPQNAGAAGVLKQMSECQSFLETSGILEYYNKTGTDSQLYNQKFNNLDIMGKFFFLTSTLPAITSRTTNKAGAIDIVLAGAERLTGAGQMVYLGQAMPLVLSLYSNTDQIGQISTAIVGTAIIYGNLSNYQSQGQKDYLKQVSDRVQLARNDYLANLQQDMLLSGREDILKLRGPAEQIFAGMNQRSVTPGSLNMSMFSNVVLNAYLAATGQDFIRGTGFNDPKGVFDQFFATGIASIIPEVPGPREKYWYGPSLDALLRELTRVDIFEHKKHLFNTLIADAQHENEVWDGNLDKSITAVDAQVYGPRGRAGVITTADEVPSRRQLDTRLIGADLSDGKNWTVRSLNMDWRNGVQQKVLTAQLDAYAGKDANLLLFVDNNYNAKNYIVRAYIKKGNVWARFFSDENLSAETLTRKYGRIISPYSDVRALVEQGNFAGAVVGVNFQKLGWDAGVVGAASTPRGVYGKPLDMKTDDLGAGAFNFQKLGWDAGVVGAASTPRGVYGKPLDMKTDDLGAGAYFTLPKSMSLDQEKPLVFARYAKVDEKDKYGIKYITNPLFAQLAGGKDEFGMELGLKSERFFLRSSYVDMVRNAYQGFDYNYYNISSGMLEQQKGEYVPQEKIKGGEIGTQYDWGERSSTFLIANMITRAIPETEKDPAFTTSEETNAVYSLKMRDNDNKGVLLQGSYYYNPYSYSYTTLHYLRDAAERYNTAFSGDQTSASNIPGARGKAQFSNSKVQELSYLFNPFTNILYENMLKTIKFEYNQTNRLLAESAIGQNSQVYNVQWSPGSWSFGVTSLQGDFNKALALTLAKRFESGMVKGTLAVPAGEGSKGAMLNLGMQDVLLPKGASIVGSYTEVDIVATRIANEFINTLGSYGTSNAPKIGNLHIRGGGLGGYYSPSYDKKYYLIMTKNQATGKTDVRVTDNMKESVNTLSGITGGVTVYSFTSNGIRNSWTLGTFAEKVTIEQLEKATGQAEPQSDMFSANRYGLVAGMKINNLDLFLKVGPEYYKTPKSSGTSFFGQVNVRWYF